VGCSMYPSASGQPETEVAGVPAGSAVDFLHHGTSTLAATLASDANRPAAVAFIGACVQDSGVGGAGRCGQQLPGHREEHAGRWACSGLPRASFADQLEQKLQLASRSSPAFSKPASQCALAHHGLLGLHQ